MKKLTIVLLTLVLTLTLALSLSACGKTDETSASGTSESAPSTTAGQTTPSVTTPQTPVTTIPADTFVEAEHVSLEGDTATIKSLNGKLTMTVGKNAAGDIVYTLNAGSTKVITESVMGITATNFAGFNGASLTGVTAKHLTASYSYLGNFSTITEDCVAATVALKNGEDVFYIEVKLYDNGVAFRYNLPKGEKSRSIRGENTAFAVNNMQLVWFGQSNEAYESEITSAAYTAISTANKLTGPLTIELRSKAGYVSLMEGYVEDTYIGTNFVSTGENNSFKVSGSWTAGKDFDSFTASGDVLSGWRVITYAEELGDLVTNTIIYNTALGMTGNTSSYEDTDWITPGKSVWSWINDRGVPFDPQINYTLNAAKLGFTYNIIDEGYTSWEDYEDKLKELGLLAEENNVKQILWVAVAGGHRGLQIATPQQAASVMKKLTEYHMSGIKLDFFASETLLLTQNIQEKTLEEGMKSGIIVNFHGVHKPTSLSVLYPNELSREGIRGLENMARGDINAQARFFTTQYYTRLLSGHADFTPDVNTAMQIASLVVLDSPLMVIATDPVDMFANPALEMIRAIPTVWDRTVFLDGSIGRFVSVAKEKDGVWYVGGIASTALANAKVDLSKFLGEGEYLLTYWLDSSTTQKEKFTQVVTANDVITLGSVKAGCGYVMQLTKLSLSQHGGEITGPIAVAAASSDAVVKYTTDGSDPATSSTAKTVENGSITLENSCTLTVAIVSGDGAGTKMTYVFNKVEYNNVEIESAYGDSETIITMTPTLEGAKIYYTTDGSDPTTTSTLYTAPLSFTEAVTVKAIAVSADGKTSSVKKHTVSVRDTIQTVLPDIYIGADYKEAVAGWNNLIAINQSMNSTTLSLGGTNANNGNKFNYGISTNAIGYFVYDIPANAKEFVGVVGIDDSTFSNTVDGAKASIICTIYIDNKLVYTSPTLRQSEYDNLRIAIPEGAKEIKIHFGDAGDGITCDNVSLANGGFLTQS